MHIWRNVLIVIFLGFISFSAFQIRLENFKGSNLRSTDEVLYANLGRQLSVDFSDYNSIEFAKAYAQKTGQDLPEYFYRPLFKYPPFFAGLMAQSLRMFGKNMTSAFYVSLLAGVLLIPCTYWLGTLVGGWKVGVVAACFIFFDPVSIICSQKIWLETTLAFFTLLSVISFIRALKTNKGLWFILFGLFCGLATNAKYPGILMVPIAGVYAFFHHKDLFKNKGFLWGMIIPFIMMIPWVLWNLNVYKAEVLSVQLGQHSMKDHTSIMLARIIFILILFITVRGINKLRVGRGLYPLHRDKNFINVSTWLVVGAIAISMYERVLLGFQFGHIPVSGWSPGMFRGELPSFYFGRLIEFSPLFLLGFASFLFYKDKRHEVRFIQYSALGTLIFYIFWSNFQSRYVLAAIPLLLVLAAYFLLILIEKVYYWENRLLSRVSLVGILVLVVFAMSRTVFINQVLSYPNNLCYF